VSPSVLASALLCGAHLVFDLGEGLLDRIEVGGVGRYQSVFLNRCPSRRRNSHTVLCETRTPRAASSSFNPCRVRLGVCLILSRMKARCGSSPLAVSAHLARCDRASPAVTLRPLHHRGNRNSEPGCSRSTAFTAQNRSNDTLTQIIGKGSGHQMLASSPASILNHNSPVGGIPSDSINPGNALAFTSAINSATISVICSPAPLFAPWQ
jgi:hypothetical protein